MPNTGRFYAPTAAAAYRDRFMRPYSTVSAPVGGHVVAIPSPKLPANASYHNRTSVFRRAEEDVYGSPSSPPVYDNRVRGRPLSSSFDRQVEEEQRYAGQITFQEKQPTKQRAWAQEVASRLSTAADVRPLETIRRGPVNPARYITSMEDVKSVVYESAGGAPSTLPRLSSLLNRNGTADQFIDEERLMIHKRPRDHSPNRGDSEPPAKLSRRFYDEGVADERVKYVESVHDKTEFSGMSRHEMPMANKNPAHLVRSHLIARRPVVSPPSSREYEGSPRYSYVRDDDDRRAPNAVQTQVRRARDFYTAEPTFRSIYEDESRGFESQRRGYYIHDVQQTHPVGMFRREAPSELDSPRPTPVSRDAFSPVSRYSDSKEGERVIEAAADLVEERSPSKRESITKLLLKSKEFLKAKSLVRNRNNEIDWVATFLNVGFECNSIYSLMCPLRKGRWKVEEEKYTMELLRLIENGTIRLRHGQSIRGFIAKKLHSDDMRVLKKLSNCKMFHFARLINPRMSEPRMSEEEEIDESMPNVRSSLDRLEKLKAEFLRSVQLEALVAVRKYLSDTSIRDLLNARD